ncbi:MAG: hypothetical protein SLAVMIC_00285 [uncultured marine phage]|uniref:Uncharacterized protein n=1 Tax=uncultured marine phage TaxID=707152 RepID=A0A8D9FS09_9VIRU|nr:MAG: hypothetical protein SLAVMIC_00285 [uncultured marine phage]
MKYIKNREQYLINQKVVEQATDQLYDGTWEDTFIGKFFSFLGRKVVHKMKKGKLNKLLEQLQRELEKSQFKTLEEEPIAQRYDVYQSIVMIKSYLKTDSDFSKEELIGFLEEAITHHTEQSENEVLPMEIRNAHVKVKDGFEEVLNYSSSLGSVNESVMRDDIDAEMMDAYPEIVDRFFDSTFQDLVGQGGSVKLGTYNPSVSGYEKAKEIIRTIIKDLSDDIKRTAGKAEDPDLAKKEKVFLDVINNIPYDDYASFSKFWTKEVLPLAKEIKTLGERSSREIRSGNVHDQNKSFIDNILSGDDSKVYVKWNGSKGQDLQGYANKQQMVSLLDGEKINMEQWDILSEDENARITSVTGENNKKTQYHIGRLDPNKISQIGDIELEKPEKSDLDDEYRRNMEDKMDEVFANDQEYKKEMTISKEEMEDLHETMVSKVEDQKNVVDPIAILRIFNRAYNSFSISKDEYDQLSSRYSPKVGARKKARYELLDNSARDKKLFREWNDGVLALLQQYGDYISNHTKKFIITMLDDNKLFGNRGAQAVLLSEYFDVPLDDAKSKLKDTDSPGEHRARLTEDEVVKFSSVNNVEMNSDKIRRVPFILEVVNEQGDRKKMSVFPMSANKGRDTSSLSVKYSSGDDYGFIKNYMEGINVELDTGQLEEMGMNDSDNEPVYSADFLSDNGFLEKGNKYRMTKIHRVSDDKGYEDTRVLIDKIYMLLGSQDEGLYRLPSLNDKMKKAINNSPHDKLI